MHGSQANHPYLLCTMRQLRRIHVAVPVVHIGQIRKLPAPRKQTEGELAKLGITVKSVTTTIRSAAI